MKHVNYNSIAVIARSRFETCCVRLFGERVVDTFHYYLHYNLLLGKYTKLAGLDLEDRLLRLRCMSVFPTLLIALFVVSGFSVSTPKNLMRLWVFSFLHLSVVQFPHLWMVHYAFVCCPAIPRHVSGLGTARMHLRCVVCTLCMLRCLQWQLQQWWLALLCIIWF